MVFQTTKNGEDFFKHLSTFLAFCKSFGPETIRADSQILPWELGLLLPKTGSDPRGRGHGLHQGWWAAAKLALKIAGRVCLFAVFIFVFVSLYFYQEERLTRSKAGRYFRESDTVLRHFRNMRDSRAN